MTSPRPQLARKRVLVAVDGSEPSLRALDVAIELARALQGRLEIISVLDVGAHDAMQTLTMTEEQYARLEHWVREEVLAVANRRVPSDGPRVALRVLRGHAVTMLLAECEADDVALLCVGRTGKGSLQKVLEGSVSRRLAKLSPVPVVVVG